MPFRGRRGRGLGHSPSALPPPLRLSAVCIEEAVDCVADKCGGEVLLAKMIQQETARAAPGSNPGPAGTHRVGRGALLALCCLTLCSRGLSSSGAPEQGKTGALGGMAVGHGGSGLGCGCLCGPQGRGSAAAGDEGSISCAPTLRICPWPETPLPARGPTWPAGTGLRAQGCAALRPFPPGPSSFPRAAVL